MTTFDGGTLRTTAGIDFDGAITLLSHGGTIDNGGHHDTFSAAIGGTGGLAFTGSGKTILSGDSTYEGHTTVTGGVLQVDGSILGAAMVNKAGTLGGNGETGTVIVAAGGTLAPGASAGILHTGSLTLRGGAHFAVQLAGNASGSFDAVDVTGTVKATGASLDLSFIGGSRPAIGSKFRIIDNDGSDPVAGTFAGLPQGAKLYAGGSAFTINYHGGTGNDVVLAAVNPNNTIIGTAGADFIDASRTPAGQPRPGPYADTIFGRGGADTIRGIAGNDRLNGDAGNNVLVGGVGADRFIFRTLDAHSRIADITPGVDKLVLAKSVFGSFGHIDYNANTGALWYVPDGKAGPVHFADLAPHLQLAASDFIFV